jgi:hypothetical protein
MSRLKDRVKSKVPKLQQLRTFSERNEEQLKQDLFEVDNNEDNEESPTYEPIED